MNTNKRLAVFLWNGKKVVTYLPWLCLPPLALVAALLLTYAQQSRSLWEALQHERFLIAAAWSFLPALLILFYIQGLSYLLDMKFYRRGYLLKRIKKQGLYGLLIPALFLATYYNIYYAAYGKNIFKRKYFQIEFPMAMVAISGMNVGYMFWHLFVMETRKSGRRKQITQSLLSSAEQKIYPKEIELNNKGRRISLTVSDIICIMRWDKVGTVLLKTGETVQMDNTLDEILEMVDGGLFARSNRWCIISLRQVSHVVYINENFSTIRYRLTAKHLLERLKPEVDKILEKDGRDGLLTEDKYKLSRQYRKSFLEKLAAMGRRSLSS